MRLSRDSEIMGDLARERSVLNIFEKSHSQFVATYIVQYCIFIVHILKYRLYLPMGATVEKKYYGES